MALREREGGGEIIEDSEGERREIERGRERRERYGENNNPSSIKCYISGGTAIETWRDIMRDRGGRGRERAREERGGEIDENTMK